MSEFSIRVLEAGDAPAFMQLRLKSYQDSPFAFSESYEDEVNKPLVLFQEELIPEGSPLESFVLGVFNSSEELVGFVKFRRDKRKKARHKSMVYAMYVAPAYRKKGLGKYLIDQVIERATGLTGLEQVHLWVLHSSTTSASAFYQKLGFKSQGLVKNDLKINGSYVDSEYMVLYL